MLLKCRLIEKYLRGKIKIKKFFMSALDVEGT